MSQDSTNLDLLRSFAVLLVLFDHTLKFLGFSHFGHVDIDWIGRLGVVFFFVHTSLVLMMSLEREKLLGWRRTVNFYIRRAFRLFPLSCFVVLFTFAAHIPQIAIYPHGFVSADIPRLVLTSNLMLTQNLIPGDFNILGQLWSLPIELDMYLVLPLLFVLALRWPRTFLLTAWPVAVALALTETHFSHLWRLNFLYYSPCFCPWSHGLRNIASGRAEIELLDVAGFPSGTAYGVFVSHQLAVLLADRPPRRSVSSVLCGAD
jgi:peptidoglycan/LPS O-acetylase OafA/YrhL